MLPRGSDKLVGLQLHALYKMCTILILIQADNLFTSVKKY